MKIKTFWLGAAVALCAAFPVSAETKSKTELAAQAISADAAVSAEAVKNLRALGREGLDALAQTYAAQIAQFSRDGEGGEDWQRIAAALDRVAMQKDAYAARLFWYTDLEEAKRAAVKTDKPILSLRLLGNLNEEFSCANSRFFRALLYSNAEVSKYLRDNYILHWKSVRPAPKVTIDFGAGRRIERTLTGNSIHYILDENGALIDALPGLYSPAAFLKYLQAGADVNKVIDKAPPSRKELAALRYRRVMFDDIRAKRDKAIAAAKVKLIAPKDGTDALTVARRAVTKMATEARILVEIDGQYVAYPTIADDFARFDANLDLEAWKKLSKPYAGATRFDDASVSFIRRQNRNAGLTEAEFARLLSNLATYVALDTTRNDFLFHTKLFEWLNSPSDKPTDLEKFNARVYAEIFKTPDSDKWLGLYNTDVYTALDGGGIVK
ncbi:MAG TPA: hypothetical protein VIL74_12085 [Pyrinomonadaceae bacterium]|jgi:hypothetical protein